MAKAREELHKAIDLLDEEIVDSVLKIVKNLVKTDDTLLTPDEIIRMKEGEAQIARGEFKTLEDYAKERGL